MILFSILSLLISNAVTLRRDILILFNRVAIIALIYYILHNITSLSIISKGISIHGDLLFNNFIYYRTKIINKMGEYLKIIEYPLILLFIISGAMFLISTSDLVSIFLSIELQSYSLYLLSTIYRNSELSTIKGGLSLYFILLSTSLLYANLSTTSIDGLYIIITTFVAIIAKISIFVFLLELVYYIIVGLTQFRIKRLFTYNTISHLGFILLALTIGFSLFSLKETNKKLGKELLNKSNSPIQLISQLKGYFYINPLLSLTILTNVIRVVYYLNIIKEIFFFSLKYKVNPLFKNLILNGNIFNRKNKVIKNVTFNYKNISISSPIAITISIITLIILLFIFINKE
ncbi:hypothetical protein CONLIGDRAFT_658172 [Coniochaeta ligniaria NRRL 30616]|uniref:NADH-ubiquinone oxidoreductase chain 2 n=1 Tax=Coniochaeta ligniaria NRRL 30616 TaxID=1408157 RepID=A0A1J7INB5_9PEZI|nr:hypothetical protein CONLIGDRAFT_658172 [Coniochaeta ligniaria NRRL 30616]